MINSMNLRNGVRFTVGAIFLIMTLVFFLGHFLIISQDLKKKHEAIISGVTEVLTERLAFSVEEGDFLTIQDILDGAVMADKIASIRFEFLQTNGQWQTMTHSQFDTYPNEDYSALTVKIDNYLSRHGMDEFMAFIASPSQSGEDLYHGRLVFNLDYRMLLQNHIDMVMLVSLMWLMGIVMVILYERWVVRNVSTPVEKMLETMRHMNDNNYSETLTVPAPRQKNMAQLITGFNEHSRMVIDSSEALRNIIEEREQEIFERTQDIREALDVAEESDRAKTEFIHLVSHELKHPLYTAKMALAVMMRQSEISNNPNVLEMARSIDKGIERAFEQIDEVLEYSSSERSSSRVNFKSIDIYQSVEEVISFNSVKAHAKGLYMDLIVDPDVPHRVLTSSPSVRHILNNLVDNAIKFTDEGGVVVHMLYTPDDNPESGFITIRVKDTGIGITDDQKNRIFESFYQGDSKRDMYQKGHGLGLCIMMNHLRLLSGDHEISSSPAGTEFSVRFRVRTEGSSMGMEQRLCATLMNDLQPHFIVMDDRLSFVKGTGSRLMNMGLSVSMPTSFEEVEQEIELKKGASHVLLIITRAFRYKSEEMSSKLKAVRSAGVDMIISLEPSSDSLENYPAMLDQNIDLAINASASTRDFLHAIKHILSPPREVLHDMFLDRTQIFEQRTLKGTHVLLVDDDQANLNFTSAYLSTFGAKVACALGADQGLVMARQEPFDVLFIDLRMGTDSGFDVADAIRRDSINADKPMFAFTSAILNEREEKTMADLGMSLMRKEHVKEDIVSNIKIAAMRYKHPETSKSAFRLIKK